MRYTIFKRGGYNQGTIGSTGGEVAGKVILSRNPIGSNEASTKSYVDVKFATLPVNSFTSGVIRAARVPEFAGDIVKLEGNAATTVKTTTVAPGIYPKVTVNIKGQITGGTVLVEGDIPVLPWSKIATGKPTTIGGYGITDALGTSGGVMTGTLKVSEVNSDTKCLANKSYVDSMAIGGTGTVTGGVIYRNDPVTPSGYLRCNGGEVSKTTYAALYAVIGDQFGGEMTLGSGKPWEQQYGFNTEQTGDLTEFTEETALSVGLRSSHVVVTKNRVYLIGGVSTSTGQGTNLIYTAPIDNNGTIGTWSASGTLSIATGVAYGEAIVTKNRVYIIGGNQTTTYTAPINPDGTLGAWTTGTSLPGVATYSSVIVTKNRVYVIGGQVDAGTVSSSIYTASIDNNGVIGTWSTASNIPGPLYGSCVILTKNRVYLLGGQDGQQNTTKVYTASVSASGNLGGWTEVSGLAGTASFGQVIVTKNKVYLNRGQSGGFITATINPDGTLGTWIPSGVNIGIDTYGKVIVTKSKLYTFVGQSTPALTKVLSIPFSGGLNDYSPFYDGTYEPLVNSSNFRLPNFTPDLPNTYAYIKF